VQRGAVRRQADRTGSCLGCGGIGERALKPGDQLVKLSVHPPAKQERGSELDAAGDVVLEGPCQDSAEVVGVGVQPRKPNTLRLGLQVLAGLRSKLYEPLGVSPAHKPANTAKRTNTQDCSTSSSR
jgi:hypothetical protein